MKKPKQFKAKGYDGMYSPERKALDIYEVNENGQPVRLLTSFNKGVRSATQAKALFNVTVDAMILANLQKGEER